MITLYDVLGVSADDDAETLKNAFRNAVKKSHPDLHADDPRSVERFRQIVRANAVLSDPDQRAVYDHLLAFERWQERSKTTRGLVLNTLRNLAADAITVMLLAVLLGGGYLVFMHVSKSSVAAVGVTEMSAVSEADPPSRQPQQEDAKVGQGIRLSRKELHELITGPEPSAPSVIDGQTEGEANAPVPAAKTAPDEPTSPAKDETVITATVPAAAAKDAITHGAPTLATAEVSVGRAGEAADAAAARSDDVKVGDAKTGEAPSSEVKSSDAKVTETGTGEAQAADGKTDDAPANEPKSSDAKSSDPKFYFEQGVASYRNGDLDRALADFNQAILLDPDFTSAYVNRSIVLYRKAETDRAFADLAQATRIQDALKSATRSHRGASAPPRN